MKQEVCDPSRSLIAFTFLLTGDLNFDFCRSQLSMVQAQMLRHTTCMTFLQVMFSEMVCPNCSKWPRTIWIFLYLILSLFCFSDNTLFSIPLVCFMELNYFVLKLMMEMIQ